jgi:hypothetical protein
MAMWHELQAAEFDPYCPHLSHFLHLHEPRPIGVWIEHDNRQLLKSDCVFRMPGESVHGDDEEQLARAHDIPVFRTVAKMNAYWSHRPEVMGGNAAALSLTPSEEREE